MAADPNDLPIEPDKPEDTMPLCPYCTDSGGRILARGPIQLGQLLVVLIYCGNLKCRKIWTSAVIGAQQQRVIAPPPPGHPFLTS